MTEYEILEEKFLNFITNKGLRKTPERVMILKVIYNYKGHFDVENLYLEMSKKNDKVSKATIYNNISLLIECGIIRQHTFEKNQAYYELSFKNKQHDHIIIRETGEIIEFCDPRIREIEKTMEELFDISIDSHSLYFYAKKNKIDE